jgi:DNA mismatch repair protein MutL
MGKIQILPDILASQVAAGEVVERPASVVKELIENSLDAGASQIAVLARRGGTALLRIVDNGSGMSREDALMSLERHATSKLRSSEGLARILTKGFRGEALPSIASVSKFTLSTRETGALTGTRVTVEGGSVLEVTDAGDAPGTSIEVRQLFYNVPARRKFLRAEDTEFSHIEQQVRVQALAHPETGFSLSRDDRLLFHLPPQDSLLGRIAGLTGQDLIDRLLEVPRTTVGPITVSGYLGEAGLWRSNRALQFTFLNRRPVESSAFTPARRAGYGEALPRGQSPVSFLLVEIDPSEVDINVHPAKREVRFRNGLAVQAALSEIIALTIRLGRAKREETAGPVVSLSGTTPVPRWTPPVIQPQLLPAAGKPVLRHVWEGVPDRPAPPRTPVVAPERAAGRPAPLPSEVVSSSPDSPATAFSGPETPPASSPEPPVPPVPTAPVFQPIGLLGSAYLILQSPEGLVLLDHRAAWERILFEQAKARTALEPVPSQALLAPLTISLSPREFDFLKPQLPALRRMGLGLEEFGANTVLIDSLPPWLKADGEVPALVSALVDDLRHANDRVPTRRLDDAAIAAAVARQSARRQAPQTMENAAALVTQLMACDMPYCRPDGSPTLLQFSWQELARKFGRP